MHEIFSGEPDPLDGMLRPAAPPDSEVLRQTVYGQTRRVLHRRRVVRRFAYAAALLVSFAVGSSVMWMSISGERGRVSAPSAQAPSTQAPSTQTPDPQAPTTQAPTTQASQPLGALTQPRSPAPDDSALAQEWIAFDSEEQRGELYRQAGDRYIRDENDLQSALRCYSNALDNATEQDLTISADDNWLLMAIKDARQKENKYAKQGG